MVTYFWPTRLTDEERKQRAKEASKKWRDNNKDRLKAYNHSYYEGNKEKIKQRNTEYMKTYYSGHKEQYKAYNREYSKEQRIEYKNLKIENVRLQAEIDALNSVIAILHKEIAYLDSKK